MLLSAPRTARLVIRCRAYSVAVRGNRSIRLFSTSGKLNEPTETSPQEIFPWKSELRPRGWTDRVQSFIRVFWAKRAFNKITLSEEDKGELRHAVVGSLWALKSAVAGIFEHSHMRKHFESTKETNNLRIDGVLNQELAPINIREIFEENLLQFFNTAIEKHCAQNKRLCIYSLLKVHGAALTNVEVVICMQRGNKIPAYVRPKTFYGATVLWPFESFFGFGDQGMETKLVDELLDAYEPDKNTTVRVMADVQCSEIFAITDVESGEVVQGSLEPRQVTHKLVLENYINGRHNEVAGSWLVADIDDWLQGNEFWAKARVQPVPTTSADT